MPDGICKDYISGFEHFSLMFNIRSESVSAQQMVAFYFGRRLVDSIVLNVMETGFSSWASETLAV